MNFNIFNSIILAGICQGIIFAVVVFLSKKYNVFKSTLFLAGIILCFSVSNLGYYLKDVGVVNTTQFYSYLYFPFPVLMPALFFGYIDSFLYPEKKVGRKKMLFIPFAFFTFLCILYRVALLVHYQNKAFYDFMFPLPILVEYIGILFTEIVLVYCIVKIFQFEKRHRENNYSYISSRLNWLKWTLGGLFILSFLWAYAIADSELSSRSRAFYTLWIGMSVMIYWLGHIGIYKFGIQEERKKIRNFSIERNNRYTPEKQKNEHISAIEKILIADKRYLDATLTLDKIAEELNLSKSHLSRIINNELGTSFPDYLNRLRVEEAKSYLNNPEFSNYTLVAIGLESGFNSKSAFNNAFKKITSQTPSEFRNSL